MDKINCSFLGWAEIEGLVDKVVGKIRSSGFRPDTIIAVARGGIVPARLIADRLIVKDFLSIKVDHWGITATKDGQAKLVYGIQGDLSGKRVLLVDDITDTGASLEMAKAHVMQKGVGELMTATLVHLDNSKYTPDFFGVERGWAWTIWPWNRHEDVVNLLKKIRSEGIPSDRCVSSFSEYFGLAVSKEEVEAAEREIS